MKCPDCKYIEKVYKKKGPHTGEYCGNCGKWLRWVAKRPVRINTDKDNEVNLIEPDNNDDDCPF